MYRTMDAIVSALRKKKVVLVKGFSHNHTLLEKHVYTIFNERVSFSTAEVCKTDRIRTALDSSRWDGTRPLVIIHGESLLTVDVLSILRKRKGNQPVLILVDDQYSKIIRTMQEIADTTVSLGKSYRNIFSSLKKGNIRHAVEIGGIESVLYQLHTTNKHDIETIPQVISDIDCLLYRVPTELMTEYVSSMCKKSVAFNSTYSRDNKIQANTKFLKNVITPLRAIDVGRIQSTAETLEYASYAHLIMDAPRMMKCPRDDQSEKYVRNVNDKIRTFINSTRYDTRKRKRV
jgi:hypothetical protein